jgi:hypothetical protein
MAYYPDPSQGLESVVSALWKLHGLDISDGRFSFRDGAFRPFDADELRNVAEAISPREEAT